MRTQINSFYWLFNIVSAGAEMKADCGLYIVTFLSRWPQGVSLAACVHLGWYLMVKDAASSQRPVSVITMGSPTSLERPPGWTATPGKWITRRLRHWSAPPPPLWQVNTKRPFIIIIPSVVYLLTALVKTESGSVQPISVTGLALCMVLDTTWPLIRSASPLMATVNTFSLRYDCARKTERWKYEEWAVTKGD